jgi:hypothetical protein
MERAVDEVEAMATVGAKAVATLERVAYATQTTAEHWENFIVKIAKAVRKK